MAFNKSLDKELASYEIGDGLKIGVYSYNGGEKKLQIGPRVYEKKDGSTGFRKAGRMTADELKAFAAIADELYGVMTAE